MKLAIVTGWLKDWSNRNDEDTEEEDDDVDKEDLT